ncbi:MAG: hypothetical protein ACOY0T_04125 [Myxococcota bacterium]
MKRAAQVAAALCIALSPKLSVAEEQRVVVLMPRGHATPWPEGTQAVIAELAASRYQVIVESAIASDLGALLEQLRTAANEEDNAGAVSVVRDRGAGIAYVWTRRDANVVQVHSDSTEGAVSSGALALRVLELIRARSLPLPESEPETPSKPTPEPPRKKTKAPLPAPKPAPTAQRALLWLGAGPTFAAGAPAPLVDIALGARFTLWQPLALDAAAAISLAPIELDTDAGSVELSARKLSMHLVFEPWQTSALRVGVGAGGGAVWIAESARAARGFSARSDNAYLGLVSLRASAALRSGDLNFVLALEPGLLVPRASVRASGEELAHVGGSWTSLTAGVGWTP